jgi:DNA-binding beta-propeller fold protein YncE
MRIALWMALAAWLAGAGLVRAAAPGEATPTGFAITPTAARGAVFQSLDPNLPGLPTFTAGQASAMAVSPDGRTLLVETSGFNRNFDATGSPIAGLSDEYVFVYDIAGPAPVKRQVIAVADTFLGLAWAPGGDRFYVSGGKDDVVLEYRRSSGGFAPGRRFALGHRSGIGLAVTPQTAGLAVSPDGRRLLAANFQNDSVSLIDLGAGSVLAEQDLRPGVIDPAEAGTPGGSFPRGVLWLSPTRAYVGAERDRELIALDVGDKAVRVASRLTLPGQPAAMIANKARSLIFVAMDNSDGVTVIDVASGAIVETIPTTAPPGLLAAGRSLGGAGSNALALSPDETTLIVSNGGENALAVVRLGASVGGRPADSDGDGDDDDRPAASAVVGLIPTGWYPAAVAVRPDGRRIYAANGKSNAGPNPKGCRSSLTVDRADQTDCQAADQYVWQLEKAGLLSLPPPGGPELARLTQLVAANDHLSGPRQSGADQATMAFLRAHIRHVIYIVKENRTYDQILGDLPVGNGDPKLAIFGAAMTPNHHALASQFVDLDAFFDSGESSNTGWNWTTAARTNDFTEREAPVNYAGRGLQYDQEGANRNINVGYATSAQRVAANPISPADPNVLPGARDVAGLDGPGGEEGRGYIWDAALRAGLWIRNWGFYGDLTRESPRAGAARIPLDREPWKSGRQVFWTTKSALMPYTDPYFRGFDQAFPDYWRFKEWNREFEPFVAAGKAPALMLVRISHDHTGSFERAIDGVNTVETELADNDYAVGLIVQAVARSPFAKDTLIFVIEDDAQDGPDHVDAHRSLALIAGPYVKHAAVISTRYTTVNLIKTMETILGLSPMGLNDALAIPMADVFDSQAPEWTFEAKVPGILRGTALPLPPAVTGERDCVPLQRRSSAYWAAAMAGQDFSREDHLDTAAFNLALWRGLKGDAPYPRARDGRDLRSDRARLVGAAAPGGGC